MRKIEWSYSARYNWWSIPEHPEVGHILDEDMPEELKP